MDKNLTVSLKKMKMRKVEIQLMTLETISYEWTLISQDPFGKLLLLSLDLEPLLS